MVLLRVAGGLALLPAVLLASTEPAAARQRALCVHDVPAGETLPVRSRPGRAAPVIGTFNAGACGVRLVGRCEGDWCTMALGELQGWVDTRYIGIYELPAAAAEASPGAGTDPAPTVAEPPPPASAAPPASATLATSVARPVAPPSATAAQAATAARQAEQGSREPVSGSCVARVARWDTLRIRSGPGVGHGAIGEIPAGACRVERVGACHGGWCRVAWRGRSGWVNAYYLD